MAGWLQTAVVIAVVVALHVPLGDYMARTLGSGRHWRAEMVLYRCCGIDPDAEQRWPEYLRSLLRCPWPVFWAVPAAAGPGVAAVFAGSSGHESGADL